MENFQIFKNKIVLETRKNGLPQLAIIDRNNNRKTYIKFKDSTYAAILLPTLTTIQIFQVCLFEFDNTFNNIFTKFFIKQQKKVWQQTFNNFEEKNYKTRGYGSKLEMDKNSYHSFIEKELL